MKTALLSLVAAVALSATAGTADARPPRYYNGGYYNSGVVYPSYSYPNYVYPAGGYYNYGSGFNFNVGGIGVSVGNSAYPSYYNSGGYYNNYYRPYYGGYSYGGYRSGIFGRRW